MVGGYVSVLASVFSNGKSGMVFFIKNLKKEKIMGTLFEQQPRQTAVKYFSPKGSIDWCRWIDKQAIELGWEVSDVLKAFEIAEMEKANALALRDGDAKDEQLAGLGKIFQNLVSAIARFEKGN